MKVINSVLFKDTEVFIWLCFITMVTVYNVTMVTVYNVTMVTTVILYTYHF